MSTMDAVPAEQEHEISNPVEECKKVGPLAASTSAAIVARPVQLEAKLAEKRVCARVLYSAQHLASSMAAVVS